MQVPRNRKLRYFSFFIVTSLACWLMASDSFLRSLATQLLTLAPLFIFWNKNVTAFYRQPIAGKPAVLAVVFTAIFVVLMVASAMSGWTKAWNDWFDTFASRPVIAAITWIIFVGLGGLAFRKEASLCAAAKADTETATVR